MTVNYFLGGKIGPRKCRLVSPSFFDHHYISAFGKNKIFDLVLSIGRYEILILVLAIGRNKIIVLVLVIGKNKIIFISFIHWKKYNNTF